MEEKVSNIVTSYYNNNCEDTLIFLINSRETNYDNMCRAISIYNLLHSINAYTVITGECYGISSLLFFSAKKENRYILSNAVLSLIPIYESSPIDNTCDSKLEDYYTRVVKDIIQNNIKKHIMINYSKNMSLRVIIYNLMPQILKMQQ